MTSPLAAWHGQRGGRPPEHPGDYGDPAAEYRALRDGAGLIDQSNWAVVRFSGPDRLSFLHKYCTQDVQGLAPGSAAYACCLTVKGALISDLWVLARAEDALCLLPPAGAQALPDHLRKFALFDQVELASADDLLVLSLVGPGAEAALREALGQAPAGALQHLDAGQGVTALRDDLGALPAYRLLVPVAGAAAVADSLLAAGATAVGQEAAEQVRVEEGRPLFGVDMDAKTIPVEAGLEQRAISYDKGCYIGQEVIARIAHRGHVNRHLRGFRLPAQATPEGPLAVFDERKQVGTITSCARSPLLGGAPVGIGIVHRKRAEPGSQVFLGASDGPAAEVCALPFRP